MIKEFNTEGWCNPEWHYMADMSDQLHQVLQMVHRGKYFIINRPRQYGKTTMLYLIDNALRTSSEWLIFNISFEAIASENYQEERLFCEAFLSLLEEQVIEWKEDSLIEFLKKERTQLKNLTDLSLFITSLVKKANKKILLLIDEVDKDSNNQLFMDFLGVLRNKYLKRHLRTEKTFYSVILTGVHDIKTLKLKIRENEQTTYNSPWNIAADFRVDMSLQTKDLVTMLEEFAKDRGLKIDTQAVAHQLFDYTSGYPFLVSNLCKIIDEELLPQKDEKTVYIADVTTASQVLIRRTNANFDSLKKNLQNNQELYDLVFDILINGRVFPFNVHDPIIDLGLMFGVFKKDKVEGYSLQIHNKIYAEVIYDFMSLKMLRSIQVDRYTFQDNYILEDGGLHIEQVIAKFQVYMKEEYNEKDRTFIERQGRLLFLAYLKPILNGKGYAFKEPQISEEKRLDIAITFFHHQYVIELKIWRGKAAHEKGLNQLADYLDRQGLQTGYLVIFDHRRQKTWAKEWFNIKGKRIFAVWV